MAIIKCKMCGGDIEISADKTFGTCEYCGSTMTLPKTDDDQRLSLFNRGTHLRRNGEFDKAAAIYERLIGENDADAEAHWNLVLCRYGIEYVQDPAFGERIPTCHRASFDSILNDVDYQAALKYSDGVARSLYEKEAQRIAALQKDILAISQKETPFDVFICYKESDENGKRTKDSALAQDIYYQLTDAGYKVFFARITLEDKLGQEYEPYIFAALHSAKVMVVVGTKPEYLNAVWVKNEWSRYLALMRADRSRLLIPCYRDMDPYDMPEELSMLQSQDMGKIGFLQDLIRGVKKVVDAAKPQEAVTETVKETVVVHNEGGSNVQALLKRGNMALEDGEWSKADEFFEQVLNQDAECGAAYLGKFLAREQVRSAKAYADAFVESVKSNAPGEKNAYACEEDEAFVAACMEKYAVPGILSEDDIRRTLSFDLGYCETSAHYAKAIENARAQFEADKDLMRAAKYDSSEAKTIMDGIPQTLDTLRRNAQQRENAECAMLTANYRDFLKEAETKLEKEHPQRLKEAEEAKKAEVYRQRKAKKLGVITGIAAAVIALIVVTASVIIPSIKYSNAEKLQAAGKYEESVSIFAALGNFKDAAQKKAYCEAELFLSEGDPAMAAITFAKMGSYQDARSRSKVLWDMAAERSSIEAGKEHTVGLKADGTVIAVGRSSDGQCRVSNWMDVVAISAGGEHTVGLKSDGSVVAVGNNDDGQCDVVGWTDIVAISAGEKHTVGVKADGTVVAVGNGRGGQCNVSDWTDIVAISAGTTHTIGLKADGTVVAAGNNGYGQCDVSDWTDIVAISAGSFYTVGLKADGTVLAVGYNAYRQYNASDWTDIVAISIGMSHTVGLKADGTVVAVGDNNYRQCNVNDWKDIVAVSASGWHTVGLKADGTVVAVGINGDGQCDVSDWTDIKLPN